MTVYHASALTELSVTAGDDDTSALFCVGRTGNVANGGVGNVAANTNTSHALQKHLLWRKTV